ncbi:MAG: metal-dependent transcriptional regulator [Bacteroidetes bacterium]|nr:MAG: metal-dependent transcriptional regulator [Bacteroidota bacterium]
MKTHTETEENYLKCVLRHSRPGERVSTSTIAQDLGTSPASVTDMLKKLSDKGFVKYTRYRGVTLTEVGEKIALRIVRKHRLWEVFLVEKLGFSWDHVHDVAEQLEHINSPELIQRIDAFLGHPKFDPHGDPIPSESGEMAIRNTMLLADLPPGVEANIAGVVRSEPEFLQYLDKVGLVIGTRLKVEEKLPFDQSLQIWLEGQQMVVGGAVAENLLVLSSEKGDLGES